MNTEHFLSNNPYIVVAVTDVYSIETYNAYSDEVLDLMRKRFTKENRYRSYVIYKLIDNTYFDIERWTAKERKEVKNEN